MQRTVILSCALAAGLSAAGAPAGREIVADPFRAAAAVWPDHSVKGRDYWIMLQTPMFALEGIRDMAFVREAGVNDYVIRTRNEGGSRAISLSEVAATGPDGRAVPVRADAAAVQDDVLIQGGEFLTDGRPDTFCVALGSRINPKTRYRGVTMRLDVRASSDVSELTLAASSDRTAWPGQVLCDSSAADVSSTGGVWRVRFRSPVRAAELRIRSQPYRFITLGIPPNDPVRARFAAAPFCVYALDRGIWGVDPRQVDLTEANRIAEDFPETYLGSDFSEWDGMLLYPLGRPASDRLKNLAAFGRIPCDRAGMRENFRMFFELAKSQKGPSLFGESANANFGLMACEWGGRQARLELTASHPDSPHRNYIMYARGAARQFGVPLSFYMAYFRYSYTPNSRVTVTTGGENWGPDWGQEISLGRRQLYACYYSGGNYQSFEAMPWGQVRKTPQGLELTKNGESIREFYDWVRSGRGTRGAVYAPVLLLTDRYAGHDQMSGERNHPVKGFGAYYGSYPPTAADFMTEYVLRAISPVGQPTPWNRLPADRMPNLKNSTLADIFDIHTANPDTPGRELRLEQLEKYSVAFLLDDIHWNEGLANTVKRYVARGGTLVLTTAQAFPYADDPSFLGATTNGVRTVDAGLVVDHVTPGAGARVLEATASGLPLVLRQPFGRGAVVLVTSPFYRKPSESVTPPPQVLALLEWIQSDVLPFSFTGGCHVIPTVCGDGRWRILVMNNAGVVTPGNTGVDQVFPECASTVTFRFPGGATVKEIRYGLEAARETLADGRLSATWTIPPGDLMVLEVSGLDLPIGGAADAGCPPVRPFPEQPYVAATPNDGYLFDPANYVAPRKTPSMIGAWKRSDGWKDSSGENHPLRLDACRIDGEGLCCTGALSGAFVHMYNLKFDIHEATEETWATPSADDLKAKGDEMRYAISRGDQRTGPDFGIGIFGLERTATDGTTKSWVFPRLDGTYLITPAADGGMETLATRAVAKTLWLAPDGNDANAGTEDAPLLSFQAAGKKVANDYTLIKVKPGSYSTNNDGYSRFYYNSSRPAAFRATDPSQRTALVGGTNARCVQKNADTGWLHLQGLTLCDGYLASNSGASFSGNDRMTLSDCVIENGYSGSGANGSKAILERCLIRGNSNKGGNMYSGCTFSSCIITGNAANDSTKSLLSGCVFNQSTIVGNTTAGTLINGTLTANNTIVVGPGSGSLDVSGFGNIVNGFATVTGSGYVLKDPMFTDAANGDYRPFMGSPAIGGGVLPTAENYGAEASFYNTAAGDFRGETANDFANVGAYQVGFPFGYKITNVRDVMTVTGVTDLEKILEPGDTATFSVAYNQNADRYSKGFYLNGEFKAWADAPAGGYVFTVDGPDSAVTIEATYTREWYVEPGAAGTTGFTPEDALATISAAMAKAEPGDTVCAAPGTYAEAETRSYGSASDEGQLYSRVVVKAGVTLQSTDGAAVTEIVGAPAPSPSYDASMGLGTNATRCVWLESGAKIKGFTLRGGHTQTQAVLDRGYGTVMLCGGGVNGAADALCQDCIITNCIAHYGSAGASVVFNRCRILGNRSARGSTIGIMYGRVFNCFFDNNISSSAGDYLTYCPTLAMNCTFGDGNRCSFNTDRQTYPIYTPAAGYLSYHFYNNLVLCSSHTSKEWNGDNQWTTYAIQPTVGTYKWRNIGTDGLGDQSFLVEPEAIDVDEGLAPAPGAADPVVCGAGNWEMYAVEWNKIAILADEDMNLDLNGVARHQNAAFDRGCFSYDWLGKYRADMTSSKALKVASASWNVVENGEGKVELAPGTELCAVWSNRRGRDTDYYHTVSVTGGGTLSVYVNGTLLETVTESASPATVTFGNALAQNDVRFVFTGEDETAATLGDAKKSGGMTLIVR